MEKNNENAVEFLTGEKTCTVSFTNQKFCNRIKKFYEKHPDRFETYVVNPDGSVYATIPLKWLKISVPKGENMTDEDRKKIADRFRKSRLE